MKLDLSGMKTALGLGPKIGHVLILDSDNVVGYRIVNLLLKEGETPGVDIRVGFRELPEEDEVEEGWECVEKVKFVWEDESTYADALKNVTTVFISTPNTSDFDKHFKPFLAAARKAHVHRFIKLSFFHALRSKAENPTKHFGDPEYLVTQDHFHDVPLVHQHALCDGDLVVGGYDCTVLFASHLMSNVLAYQGATVKEEQKFYGGSGGKGVNYVSPNDVAYVAVLAILDPKTHKRQGYTLTGPAPITDQEVAKLLSTELETTVTYVEKPLNSFTKDSAAFERLKASGVEEENFPKGDFERLSGRKPEKFEDYLANQDTMAPVEKYVFSHALTMVPAEMHTLTMVPKIEQEFPEPVHTLTMMPKIEQDFPEPKHTLTMVPKIEQDFPEEPHFITLVPKTEATATPADTEVTDAVAQ